jgi:hypothetical protein
MYKQTNKRINQQLEKEKKEMTNQGVRDGLTLHHRERSNKERKKEREKEKKKKERKKGNDKLMKEIYCTIVNK